MVHDTLPSQDVSTNQIWNSYLKEYRICGPDRKAGRTDGGTDSAITICLLKFLWGHKNGKVQCSYQELVSSFICMFHSFHELQAFVRLLKKTLLFLIYANPNNQPPPPTLNLYITQYLTVRWHDYPILTYLI